MLRIWSVRIPSMKGALRKGKSVWLTRSNPSQLVVCSLISKSTQGTGFQTKKRYLLSSRCVARTRKVQAKILLWYWTQWEWSRKKPFSKSQRVVKCGLAGDRPLNILDTPEGAISGWAKRNYSRSIRRACLTRLAANRNPFLFFSWIQQNNCFDQVVRGKFVWLAIVWFHRF